MFLVFFYFCFSAATLYYYHNAVNTPNDKIRSIVILSGEFDWDTEMRTKKGIQMAKRFKDSKVVLCGKYKNFLMQEIIKDNKCKNLVIQVDSRNTYEDALFLKKKLKSKNLFPMVLVTSQPHLSRAIHTFNKVFKNDKTYGVTTKDYLNIYSPFLPSGWIAAFVNIIKDWKYNGRII